MIPLYLSKAASRIGEEATPPFPMTERVSKGSTEREWFPEVKFEGSGHRYVRDCEWCFGVVFEAKDNEMKKNKKKKMNEGESVLLGLE